MMKENRLVLQNSIFELENGSNTFKTKKTNLIKYRFKLTGVPPDQAIKLVELDPNNSIAKIKKIVQKEYKLNPILSIQFIFKGKVLPDQLKFAKIGIYPKKDEICVMSTQSGAGKREMKCLQCETMNVNEMLVSFEAEDENRQRYNDTTTLSKFLYYLEHPSDRRGEKMYQPTPFKIIKVNNYCCVKCHSNKEVEGKRGDVGLRIPSRRFGI